MNQIDAFSTSLPRPMAHRDDPSSSHVAAEDAKDFQWKQAAAVLAALKRFPNTTSAELARMSSMDLYAVRRRLNDMKGKLVERIDPTEAMAVCAVAGKKVCRWRPV